MPRPTPTIAIDGIIKKYLVTDTLSNFVEIEWRDQTGARIKPSIHKLVSTRKTSPTSRKMFPTIEIEYHYPNSGAIPDDFDAAPIYNGTVANPQTTQL